MGLDGSNPRYKRMREGEVMKGKDLNRKRKPYGTHYWRYMSYVLKQIGIELVVVHIDFMTGKVLYSNQKKVKR